jgi:hypothetical protein
MKKILRFLPWTALLALAAVSVPRMGHTAPPPAEPHPHIRAAIHELREARRELQTAARDFCGHRKDAVHECDEALRQLQKALDCDRN